MKRLFTVSLVLALAACAGTTQPLAEGKANQINNVCIVKNPKVMVSGFTDVLQQRLQYHGIASTLVDNADTAACPYQLTYTARRTWNGQMRMARAELRLWENQQQIAFAEYKNLSRSSNGINDTVAEKMNPIIDALLNKKKRVGL
ncbi:Sbal_3080 family lipoprotein [Stenoxybacter acetivorans]|uniref:Sbal_3080 family lipoprotein n=1 Tax=Stenoxybacter acetivorans TaxID=422441 RepID=UPI00068E59C9|nr:Sbal_3080 family lipoprotein [Stenoxybacter acetivorans]